MTTSFFVEGIIAEVLFYVRGEEVKKKKIIENGMKIFYREKKKKEKE